jgi:hypothetical protein
MQTASYCPTHCKFEMTLQITKKDFAWYFHTISFYPKFYHNSPHFLKLLPSPRFYLVSSLKVWFTIPVKSLALSIEQ